MQRKNIQNKLPIYFSSISPQISINISCHIKILSTYPTKPSHFVSIIPKVMKSVLVSYFYFLHRTTKSLGQYYVME